MNFLSVLFMLCISVYCTAFRNRNAHLCSVLKNTHKSYYNNQYHFCQKWNRRRTNRAGLKTTNSNRGGKNGAASNDGILIKWEKVSGELIFVLSPLICWPPQAGGGGSAAQAAAAPWSGSPPRARRRRCSGTGWGSTGPAGSSIMAGLVTHWQDGHVPWSRHAVLCHLECPRQCCDPQFRMVYQMTNSSQQLYYMIGQFDGWLLGPEVGLNYGGIKNTHDGMCVQSNPG